MLRPKPASLVQHVQNPHPHKRHRRRSEPGRGSEAASLQLSRLKTEPQTHMPCLSKDSHRTYLSIYLPTYLTSLFVYLPIYTGTYRSVYTYICGCVCLYGHGNDVMTARAQNLIPNLDS